MDSVPQIPDYDLLDPLGGGQLSVVYSARHCASGELCAVKVLRPEWEEQPTGIKLLQREARAGLSVRHPHLVGILEAHVTMPPYFLVMELLDGESLRSRLNRENSAEMAASIWIIRQVAQAMAALHRKGFIHGDIKPDNIRLADDRTAKIIDLGFAHRPGENAVLRESGYVLGTPDYMSPEACAFVVDPDERSDIFSLGVTLFEMLTGRLPIRPGTTIQTLQRHCCERPADIRDFNESLPAPLVNLVHGMLSRFAADRPRASAVVQQLIALEIANLPQRRSA